MIKVIGIGNDVFGDVEGKLAEEFGGVFLGPRIQDIEKYVEDGDEVILIDSTKRYNVIFIDVDHLYPGILGYSELENYLLNLRKRVKIFILAYSIRYKEEAKCFLNCLLSKKSKSLQEEKTK